VNYEVTWCGDGIKDNYITDLGKSINEECDPMDRTKNNWGTGGCSTQCKSVEKPKPNVCDQISYRKLRHGRTYRFLNRFRNKSGKIVKIKQNSVTFSDIDNDLNNGENPNFKFTSWIKNKKFQINNGEEGKIYEAIVDYPIISIPKHRSKDNIFIKYTVKYYTIDKGKKEGPFFNVHCDYNEVTWCGDGVIDNYTEREGFVVFEECDDGNTKSGDGCSSTCQLEK